MKKQCIFIILLRVACSSQASESVVKQGKFEQAVMCVLGVCIFEGEGHACFGRSWNFGRVLYLENVLDGHVVNANLFLKTYSPDLALATF